MTSGWPVHKIPVRRVDGLSPPTSAVVQVDEAEQASLTSPQSKEDEIAKNGKDQIDWQKLALQLRADMDNFRKRQIRRADEAIVAERERLLRLMLPVVDNLIRALQHNGNQDETLQQGVELTYRELMRTLEAEGVTLLETVGQPFDPDLHEALATTPTDEQKSGHVVEEVETGYKLGDKLLRPARVIVAA
jgi:molecular chaperone GrpE